MKIGKFDLRGSTHRLVWEDYTDDQGRARRRAIGVRPIEDDTIDKTYGN